MHFDELRYPSETCPTVLDETPGELEQEQTEELELVDFDRGGCEEDPTLFLLRGC